MPVLTGGFKNPSPVSTMVLLPLIRSRVDIPIIAAGGISDGLSMAGAFAMGAEGVQMGTRMVSCSESPVHDNWKAALVNAKETDTVFLNQQSRPALRALRTERTGGLAFEGKISMQEHIGDMEAAIPLTGQVCGRIDSVLSAEEIVQETMADFHRIINKLAAQYISQ
jgi:enoyl-[acyl-carrier protein] reductase II